MMIQQQTLAVDNETRARLLTISSLIYQHRNNPERVKTLIAEHDELVKKLDTKLYDPHAEERWA